MAQTDACGPRKLTKKIEKEMGAAQTAYNNKQWDEVLAKVAAVEAAPVEKSEFDKYWLHEFQGISYANLKKYPEALRELQAALESPCMDEAEKPARHKIIMQVAYQSKDYAKAIDFGNRYMQANPDPNIAILIGNAYYATDDFTNARKVLSDVITKLEASGATPEEQTYRIVQSACLNLKDEPCVVQQIEKLVTHYPKPNYWQDLTNFMLRDSKNDKELLNILRLSEGVQTLNQASHYTEMAQLSIAQGLPGEAQSVLDKGFQAGVFKETRDKERATRLLADAKTAAALDKSTLAKQAESARAKPTGDADVKLGAAYLSYGEVPKAIEALQRGISKGGVKNADEAGLLLGIAYMRANNKAEAANAFRTVKQDPLLTRIAQLWLLSAGAQPATAQSAN